MKMECSLNIDNNVNELSINELIKRKHDLIRQFERKEIENNDYVNKFVELELLIKSKTDELIFKKQKNQKQKTVEIENVKEELKIESKKIRNYNTKTFSSLILDVLLTGKFKTVNDVAIEVKQHKDENLDKIVNRVKRIIHATKKGMGRFKLYKWDNENFKIVKINS